MPARAVLTHRWNPALTLFLLLLGALWMAGGASHADVTGQVVTRGAAWSLLVLAILLGVRPVVAGARPVFWLLLATVLLVLLQLVPLPPNIWTALPGRDALLGASPDEAIWRPWAIVPSATANAASSLIVPVVTFMLMSALRDEEKPWLPTILLGVIFCAMLVGLLQFSSFGIDNPFINDSAGAVGGTFANRNHFALLLAMGCLITPVWAFAGKRSAGWRAPVALGLITLFALTILATGSRAGLLTGLLALALGLALCWHDVGHALRGAPRWVFPALIAAIVGVVALFVLVSIAADRAESVRRAFEIDAGQDMRTRGLPTVLAMIAAYFPAGSGFGGFDPIFRLHEPFALLKPTYFNHAHNDFLEVVLDGGLPALLLLIVAIGWYAIASVRAWRASGRHAVLPKLGSAMLLLVLVASVFDYPARTPMIMAMIVIAASWLCQNRTVGVRAAFT
ncbi:O-antigen ligase [Sphingobium wenxiniae]|uniref:O-antigen ligase n=1 Tax=Sphingobium wenxiniae (strain DSM 21828 / CGMCC 1.7748 / JZ-1) TaxID=595605 RepID=A0A562K559_SPHWJ|nr:O-antigen ligase family protein [Sphingobium wenxiniae]MBB6192845.1 O-antigen ligase [Sphingobium wenxiniae]TWH90537.1 O-antigen ligase [Sphingobium wenxiniae]